VPVADENAGDLPSIAGWVSLGTYFVKVSCIFVVAPARSPRERPRAAD